MTPELRYNRRKPSTIACNISVIFMELQAKLSHGLCIPCQHRQEHEQRKAPRRSARWLSLKPWLLGLWPVLQSSLALADSPSLPHGESFTRLESTAVLGADPETGCPPSATDSSTDSSTDSAADTTGSSSSRSPLCVQHTLLELLTVAQPVSPVNGLRIDASLRYGVLFGDAPQADLLASYGSRGDLKVLGLTASWQPLGRPWSVVLGRQSRWDADPLLFDGLQLRWRQVNPTAARSLDVSLYAGLWTSLDADVRAQALYGALFSQQVPASDAQGASAPLDVQNPSPALLGASVLWRPLWPVELGLSDTFYQGLHHTRLGLRWEPLPPLTLYGEARSLDLRPRDLRLGVQSLRSSGASLNLQLRHAFEGEFPLSALLQGVQAQGATRLLIGNSSPYSELRLEGWRPVSPTLLAGLRLGWTQVDAADEQAYQRSLLELGIQSHWQPHPWLSASLDLVQVLAPQAGQFTDVDELVLNDGEGDALDLNSFPNLSGEGEEAMLELASQVRVRVSRQVQASLGGGAVWLQKAYTAFVVLEDGVGGRAWVAAQWEPSSHLRADVRYLLEQELNAGIYGESSTVHEAALSLRARW